MKHIQALFCAACLWLGAAPAFAQEAPAPIEECQMELSSADMASITAGKQYYNSFRVDGKGGRVQLLEFNLVMRAGQRYHFNIRTPKGGADGIVMKVYDRRTKERVLTNFSEGGSITGDFSFECQETGVYDVRFSFKGSHDYCGVCICSITP
jgi:hypothetical protein